MAYVFIDRFAPVVVARRTGSMNAEHMRAMMGDFRRALEAAGEKIALVYDAGSSAAGRPDAASRRVAADWFREQHDLLVQCCAGFDFAFPSPISRGVLTAIFWVQKPPVPTAVHGHVLDAVAMAAERVGRRDIDPREVASALDALG